jgi:hypothetical protein
MLGKVAEKRDHDPSAFLGHFTKVKALCDIISCMEFNCSGAQNITAKVCCCKAYPRSNPADVL